MINRELYVSWKNLPWKKFRENLFLVQHKIFNCIKYKNFKKALLIQHNLLGNYQLYYLAIRKITQLRLDRKIPGIDKKLIKYSFERKKLITTLKRNLYCWKYRALARVYLIDFIKGKTLIFVPTIFDRVIQYIWSLILEPVFNSLFFEGVIQLSSIQTCLYAKYSIILNLIYTLDFKVRKIFHIKLNSFSSFLFTFDPDYLIKTCLFPDEYKRLIINGFRPSSVLNLKSNETDLKAYLSLFDYYLISFGFFGLEHLFLKRLTSKLFNIGKNVKLSFQYFDEIICLLDKVQTESFVFTLNNKLTSTLSSSFFFDSVVIRMYNCLKVFHFLDWNFIVLNSSYKIIPSYTNWLEYKILFKQIIKNTKYTIFQRITFLRILVKNRFQQNWFCDSNFSRREFYILKIWFNNDMKRYKGFSKFQRDYILKQIFKSYRYIVLL
jgi:RNA-directed DNA polymerase